MIPKAHETALPGLHQSAVEAVAREIEVVDNLAVQLDSALRDHPSRFARRTEAEELDQQGRQMKRIPGG